MFQRILKCDFDFISPWWDDVSENAKVSQDITYPSLYDFFCLFIACWSKTHKKTVMLFSSKLAYIFLLTRHHYSYTT